MKINIFLNEYCVSFGYHVGYDFLYNRRIPFPENTYSCYYSPDKMLEPDGNSLYICHRMNKKVI